MGDFPITRARERLGFTPAVGVRADGIDTDTGGKELGAAMSRLGGTITELGLKYDLKEANTQFSKYKSEIGKLDVMRDAEVLNAADSDEVKAIYERYEKQKEALKPTNRRASEAAGIWDNQQAPKTAASMFNARRGKTIDNERTRIFEKEQEVYADPSKLPEFEKELARSIILDKNSPDDTGPTFSNEEAAKILARVRKGAIKAMITKLYRSGAHVAARKLLEATELLSAPEKEDLDDEIDVDEKASKIDIEVSKRQVEDDFANTLNDLFISTDDENLNQTQFRQRAEDFKAQVKANPLLDGVFKTKMLNAIRTWAKGTNEIDYARILSLNQEMDAAQRSGIVDPTIRNRIVQANLEGAFGGRNKGGQTTYAAAMRRFEKLTFDERVQAIAPIVRTFERENADDPRLVFLFHQAKNKLITENPDYDTRKLFIEISALSDAYGILPEATIVRKMQAKTPETILMISPDGKQYKVPIEKKQKFIDNGFTE